MGKIAKRMGSSTCRTMVSTKLAKLVKENLTQNLIIPVQSEKLNNEILYVFLSCHIRVWSESTFCKTLQLLNEILD